MSHDLQQRQEKIQAKRKRTSFRDFVREICSREPMCFYKINHTISKFSPSDRIGGVISQHNFQSPGGREYTGFFWSDIRSFWQQSLFPAVVHFATTENAEYADTVHASRNVYLSKIVTFESENILYSIGVKDGSKNILNSRMICQGSQNVYQSNFIHNSYNVFYSRYILDSSEIWLSSNLVGCDHCIQCSDLEQQSYCINNTPVKKEEYKIYLQSLLNSQNLYDLYSSSFVGGPNRASTDSDGHGLLNAHHTKNAFNSMNIQHAQNVIDNGGEDLSEHFYDTVFSGRGSHFYAIVNSGAFSEHIYCSISIVASSYIYYSYYLENCSFCLGCIGLKNKSYCILNKQYTKEERYEKVDEIFAQMEKDGRLGEFFPASMNPFYFNDTAAYLIDSSFTKEEVTAKGYLRRDEPIKVDIPEGAKVVKTQELGQYEGRKNDQRYIDPEILKVIIQDDQGNIYKIVKMEYDFLMKYGLPLPRKHWLDRMKENFRIQ